MGKQESSTFRTLTIGTMGILLASLVAFFYTFFAQTYPKTVARIDVIEERVKNWVNLHRDLKADLTNMQGNIKDVRDGQKELLILLLDSRRKKR